MQTINTDTVLMAIFQINVGQQVAPLILNLQQSLS